MPSNPKNVLIFSGASYPAIQMIDCLKHNPLYHIIAAGSYPNHSEFVCSDTITDLPFLSDPSFLSRFIAVVRERDIKLIIPTDESIAMVLKEHEPELGAVVVCSPYETARLCRHKKLMFEALAGEPYVPAIYDAAQPEQISEYPVFAKPDSSQGSRGAQLIGSAEELKALPNPADMVICEYLPGEEYTVDCFTNRDGQLIFCNPRVRSRLMNGITARGSDVPCTGEFREVMDGLNRKIAFRGYWYAQLKRDRSGRLKLLEICTRFAGSFAISKGKGINLPLLALCDFDGRPAEALVNDYTVECDKTYVDRYRLGMTYDQVYVDYDDTVTLDGGHAVNPYVIAYLYQCRSKKIRISLITRHQDTFGETLRDSFARLSISEKLFDDIMELRWDQEKADFIRNADSSIFLDNSFAERKKVHDRLAIPVFDISNIDCLFDWRQ